MAKNNDHFAVMPHLDYQLNESRDELDDCMMRSFLDIRYAELLPLE